MKFSEEKLNELLEKYACKSEDLTFDLEAIESDEALEEAFEAQFSNPSDDPESEPKPETQNFSFAVTLNGETKQFSKSLNELIMDITTLVNAQYGDEDADWYDCEVFDDKTVYMHGFFNGKHYKQKYGYKENSLVLKGERTEVFVRYLTEDELSALEDLKSNFEAKSKELDEAKELISKYEAEPQKLELLHSQDYKQVAQTETFAELMKKETYFDLSLEDVKAKADEILLNAAKAGKVEFAKVEPSPKDTTTTVPLVSTKTKKRYVGLDLG